MRSWSRLDAFVEPPFPIPPGPTEESGRLVGVGDGSIRALLVVDDEAHAVRRRVARQSGTEGRAVTLHGLVGVDPQDPLARARRQSRVAGGGEVLGPWPFEHDGARSARDVHRVVDRAGVVDDDLVDDAVQRREARR
jgi:hypothetical protein